MFADGVKKFALNVMGETYILHLNKCGRDKGQGGNSYRAKEGIETEAKKYPMNWRPGPTPQSAPPFAPQ